MAIVLAQVSIEPISHNPKDRAVNTFHFDVAAPETQDYDDLRMALDVFYDDLGVWYAPSVATSGHIVKFYDLTDDEPRAPKAEIGLSSNFNPDSATSLPAEVAMCVSYRAATPSGINPARRRGRVYIGPLGTGCNLAGRPVSGFITDLAHAGPDLVAQSQSAGCPWVVYSRADDVTGSGASTFGYPVVGGFVDDAFDTQRRRGVAGGTRQLWPS